MKKSIIHNLSLSALLLVCMSCQDSRMEMTSERWSELLSTSIDYLEARQQACVDEYQLTQYEDYFWDQEKGTIVFSTNDVPLVEATIQFVGSYAPSSETWLWAWANDSLEEGLTSEILVVRDHGRQHGFGKLVEDGWPADEADGWEMTAISAYLLKAKGAYRSPGETSTTYMIFKDIDYVE